MKHRLWLSLFLFAAAGLAGCGGSTSLQSPAGADPAGGTDEAQIATELQANPDYVNEGVWQDETPMTLDEGSGFAAIRPLRFWREIRHVESDLHTEYLNPDPNGRPLLAIVTIRRHLLGSFNILAGSVTAEDTTRALVRKPLDDLWTRRIALVRFPLPGDTALSRWRLAGTSGVDVRTRDGDTRLASLRIQSGDLDTTITEPLELHRLRRVLKLAPDAEVRLTATTADPTDVVLFHGFDLRRRFVNHGDGTHSFRFPSGHFPGLRHFGVDALSRGTLFDDAERYDANAWILAYVVLPERSPIGS
jgi:hypothetical protein